MMMVINGQLHRKDGPAVIGNFGYRAWYFNGKCHRENGPAVCGYFNYKEWWYLDIKYTEKEYKRIMRTRKLKKILDGRWQNMINI